MANSGDPKFEPLLERLAASSDEVVKDAAAPSPSFEAAAEHHL
jgi:hypothetical protein